MMFVDNNFSRDRGVYVLTTEVNYLRERAAVLAVGGRAVLVEQQDTLCCGYY